MADLGTMYIAIELTPEVRDLLEGISAKLDEVNEKLSKQAEPLQIDFKLSGADLVAVQRNHDYRPR